MRAQEPSDWISYRDDSFSKTALFSAFAKRYWNRPRVTLYFISPWTSLPCESITGSRPSSGITLLGVEDETCARPVAVTQASKTIMTKSEQKESITRAGLGC